MHGVHVCCLLAARVLGDSLSTLGYGVLGKLSWQEETDGGLNLPGSQSGASVVVCEAACLGGNALEDVVHEGVHDAHGLGGDTSIGVNLLQHLVDVDGIRFLPFAVFLLVSLGDVLLGLSGLFGSLSRYFGGHGAS